jgi:hypothetical protein
MPSDGGRKGKQRKGGKAMLARRAAKRAEFSKKNQEKLASLVRELQKFCTWCKN